jgi:hypothetical protein
LPEFVILECIDYPDGLSFELFGRPSRKRAGDFNYVLNWFAGHDENGEPNYVWGKHFEQPCAALNTYLLWMREGIYGFDPMEWE